MGTNFEYTQENLYTPVVFRSDFNSASLSLNQAWSLFFTAGDEENLLGKNPQKGWFFSNFLMAIVVAGIIGAVVFNNFATIQFPF